MSVLSTRLSMTNVCLGLPTSTRLARKRAHGELARPDVHLAGALSPRPRSAMAAAAIRHFHLDVSPPRFRVLFRERSRNEILLARQWLAGGVEMEKKRKKENTFRRFSEGWKVDDGFLFSLGTRNGFSTVKNLFGIYLVLELGWVFVDIRGFCERR